MKRKLLAGMMTMLLAASTVMPAAAADKPEPQVGTMTLTAEKGSTYTLSIPETPQTIAYGSENSKLGFLKVMGNVNIGESVTVDAQTNAFERKGSINDKIPFTLMDTTGTVAKAYTAVTWDEDELRAEEAKKIPLSINIPTAVWENAKAGGYTGTIVFTATFNETAPSPAMPQ